MYFTNYTQFLFKHPASLAIFIKGLEMNKFHS